MPFPLRRFHFRLPERSGNIPTHFLLLHLLRYISFPGALLTC
jgi:hypothetical protein